MKSLHFTFRQQEFLKTFENKSYTDIFLTRIKFGGSHIRPHQALNANLTMFQQENQFGTKRNVLYISLPFCLSRCKYCLFFNSAYNKETVDKYIQAIEKEVFMIKDTPYIQTTQFESIYFGGGTPSTLTSDQINRLLKIIQTHFKTTPDVEITFEANSYSITSDKMKTLKSLGVNRTSVGVQTFNDQILKEMNCKHDRTRALESINSLLGYGFKVNIDMIYGFQGQEKEELYKDLSVLLEYSEPHQLTYFPLRINSDTLLFDGNEHLNAEYKNDNHTQLLEYDAFIHQTLSNNNYIREDIPIFYYKTGSTSHKYGSLEGRIIGLGAGGGTLFDHSESVNVYDPDIYIKTLQHDTYPVLADSLLTMMQSYERFIFYRILFMNRNLPAFRKKVEAEFEDYFNVKLESLYDKVVNDMINRNLIFYDGTVIKFTSKFDSVLEDFRIGMPSIN